MAERTSVQPSARLLPGFPPLAGRVGAAAALASGPALRRRRAPPACLPACGSGTPCLSPSPCAWEGLAGAVLSCAGGMSRSS